MPVDRTWYHALIDDDGSGLTGSVWDKADINNLLNSVDAALGFVEASKTIWTPAILTLEGANCVQAGTLVDAHYSTVGHMLFWSFYAAALQVPAGTANLRFGTPPGKLPTSYNDFSYMRCVPAPGSTTALGFAYSDPGGQIMITAPTAFGVGTTHLMGQGFYWF